MTPHSKVFGQHRTIFQSIAKWLACLVLALGWTALHVRLAFADLNPRDTPSPLMLPSWAGPNNQFVTTSIEDKSGWWWGTDNDGLWHYAPNGPRGDRWKHFRAEDGLYDDSITCLCVDRVGRLWVGTERRGVSVFNNSWWHNYDIMTGPLGSHVNAITLNPINGDVWIASEAGIGVYSDTNKSWRYITIANGLITDKINCLAFEPSGVAILGTYSEGLLIASPKNGYSTWTHVTAPMNASTNEVGSGIPFDQINCLLVSKRGTIFCGTSSGFAESSDAGRSWQFLHGWNWQLKITRFAQATQQVQYNEPVTSMNDDFVTALAYDSGGLLYIGHRQGGVEVYNDRTQSFVYHNRIIEYGTDIRSLTVLHTGGLLIGNFGDGITRNSLQGVACLAENAPNPNNSITTFPVPASAPTDSDLSTLIKTLDKIAHDANLAQSYFLDEDWQTQGNWIGRYGKRLAVLCAADGSSDYLPDSTQGFSITPTIGLQLDGNSNVSNWLQWEETGDPRVLYDPEIANRRESVWDDRGENWQRQADGPDIWLKIQVPAGAHRLALYFMNNEGHTRTDRYRDYLVQTMPNLPTVDFRATYDQPTLLPTLAQTRVENFWPGVYEDFILIGPGSYYVKISRNFSLNTIMQGAFLDQMDTQANSEIPVWQRGFSLVSNHLRAAHVPKVSAMQMHELAKIKTIWSKLNSLYNHVDAAPLEHDVRILLLRGAAANGASEQLLAEWRDEEGVWTGDDWSTFEQAISKMNTSARVKPKS